MRPARIGLTLSGNDLSWSPSMRYVRLSFAGAAWLFLGCVLVQVFLAGLGVFAGAANFSVHRDFGYTFGWLTLIMLILALAGRLGRRWVGFSALLLVLFALQSVFIALRESMPAAAALHPVNALAIFYTAQLVARRSLGLVSAPQPPQPAPQPEGAQP